MSLFAVSRNLFPTDFLNLCFIFLSESLEQCFELPYNAILKTDIAIFRWNQLLLQNAMKYGEREQQQLLHRFFVRF